MAVATVPLCVFGDGVTVSFRYDDSTGVLSAVTWTNDTGRAFTVTLTRPDGKSFSDTLPPGSGSLSTPGQNARRFTFTRGADSGDSDPGAWVSNFAVNVGR